MASFNEIINQKTPVLVDFKADWCQPCKMMTPILKQVKQHYKDKIKIIKIDIDHNPAVARKFGIRGVPTSILFKEGKAVWRQSGVMPANQLIPIIGNYL
ncbi:MAG: thioredoxin [Flavobacteriia bacterium]|nr:MAG: thioredoxin [Flavobacteriia bacterium]